MSEHIQEVNEDNFDQVVLQSKRPVLVDFWAEWCRPCWMLAPIVETVAREYAGHVQVAKVNVDDSPAIAQRYGIQGIPTLILFKGGKEAERIIGVASEGVISLMIDRALSGDDGSGISRLGTEESL